jgi:alpha-beta hydrolase superfamily lysophospholipase
VLLDNWATYLLVAYDTEIFNTGKQETMKKIFLHGLESSSRGAKARFLQGMFPDMLVPDFSGSLSARMTTLASLIKGQADLILVGSSFGGLMATIYAMANEADISRLVLLAPALNFPEFSNYPTTRIAVSTWIFIGSDDTVTPAKDVVPLARQIFSNLIYEEVADDHMLARTFRHFDWPGLLNQLEER